MTKNTKIILAILSSLTVMSCASAKVSEPTNENSATRYEEAKKKYSLDVLETKDPDDLQGENKVMVVDKATGEKSEKTFYFGVKLSDFKDKYDTLLLDKSRIKFSDDGSSIIDGFNPDLTAKLEEYNPNLKFITEITDEDKNTVGVHNITRKIMDGDKLIYEKKDKAFVNMPGATVAVIDKSFYGVGDKVESRMYRLTDKKDDYVPDFFEGITKDDARATTEREVKQGLARAHGANVIGSMIDESTVGDIKSLIFATNIVLKSAETDAYKNFANKGDTDYNLVDLTKEIIKPLSILLVKKVLFSKKQYVTELFPKITNMNKLSEKIIGLDPNKDEDEIRKNLEQISEIINSINNINEEALVDHTNLHFATIAAESNGKIDPVKGEKKLETFLNDNPGIKVVNLSYGNDFNVEEYVALKNMTQEQKEKAVELYNNNVAYRVAITSWLKSIKNQVKDVVEEQNAPNVDYGLYDYFEDKDKITVDDFDKLITTKLALYDNLASRSPILKLSNHDILFIRSHGNADGGAYPSLTGFDKDGNKLVYRDPNQKVNSGFASIPTFINLKDKEKAEKEGKEYKYSYNYRKNILSVVGVAPKTLPFGAFATDDINDSYGLFTIKINLYKDKLYAIGMQDEYNDLKKKIEDFQANPSKYSEEYKKELKARIDYIDGLVGKTEETKLSFNRAGEAKLWTIAANAIYFYNKKLSEEEKKYNEKGNENNDYGTKIEIGSSFSAPRVTATAGLVANKYPWMTAHQIKQTLVTTADGGYVPFLFPDVEESIVKAALNLDSVFKISPDKVYGVNDITGWGILNTDNALKGPARLTKALTHETVNENFIANIPYGEYTFDNIIYGGFDPSIYGYSKGQWDKSYIPVYNLTKMFTDEQILNAKSYTDLMLKAGYFEGYANTLGSALEKLGISREELVNVIRPKIKAYIKTLPFEEQELFEDAGLIKDGKGTLIITHQIKSLADTVVKNGTLKFKFTGDFGEATTQGKLVIEKDGKVIFDKKGRAKGDIDNYGKIIVKNDFKTPGTLTTHTGSEIKIQLNQSLSAANADFKDDNNPNISFFKTPNLVIFSVPTKYKESIFGPIKGDITNIKEAKTQEEKESILKKYNERTLFEAESVKAEDLSKFTFGEKDITSKLKLITTKTENPDGTYTVNMTLERINPITVEDIEGDNPVESLSSAILARALNNGSKEDLISLNNYEALSSDEAATLDGTLLANSEVIGYDMIDLRNQKLKDYLNGSNKSSIFASGFGDLRIRKDKDNKNFLTGIEGTLIGGTYSYGIGQVGAAFDYTHSKLKKDKDNHISYNGFGLNLSNRIEYKDFDLLNMLSGQALRKDVTRKVGTDSSNFNSIDYVIDSYNELGYSIKALDNKLNVRPFVGLDLIGYIRGKFNEDTDFGYSANESSKTFKAIASLGANLNYKLGALDLGGFASFSKFLTNNTIKTKGKMDKYNWKQDIEGIKLDDNNFKFGINAGYTINRFRIDGSYVLKNISDHVFGAGISYKF